MQEMSFNLFVYYLYLFMYLWNEKYVDIDLKDCDPQRSDREEKH